MQNGWIKLHRKLLANSIFSSEKGLKIWIWCLLKANHKSNDIFVGRQKVSLLQGQFAFGRKKASQELEMSASTVWFWMLTLESNTYIDIKRTSKYSIVTINKWKEYQLIDSQVVQKKCDKSATKDTNKNVKNVKNEKKDIVGKANEEFSFDKKLTIMFLVKDKRMSIIANYWQIKKFNFNNKEQYLTNLKRELRPAGNLKGYELKRIIEKMNWLEKNADFKWTLETVFKYINENTDLSPEQEAKKLISEVGQDIAMSRFQTKYGDEGLLKYKNLFFS